MPTLHLQVCAGFANRVRAMISGLCAAEDLKIPLVIHWPSSPPECGCRASAVLDPESLPKTVKLVASELYEPREVLSREDWDQLLLRWNGQSDLNIKSHGVFYTNPSWESYLRSIKPSPAVKELLQRRCAPVSWSKAVGVHIRRTDNMKSILGSPLESFQKAMRSIPSVTFVIATDDLTVREVLLNEFGPRCIFPSITLSRLTEEGMVSAVTDFFALSKCSKILGSVSSSFSEIAAKHGGCPFELVLC